MNQRKRIYRRVLIGALSVNLFLIGIFTFLFIKNRIPSDLKILVNEAESIDLSLNGISGEIMPEAGEDVGVLSVNNEKLSQDAIRLNLSGPFSLKADKTGNYKLNVKLFGLISLKQVNLDIIEGKQIIPCGFPVGIDIDTKGVMVLGTGAITGMDGLNYEPALNILKSGDYIIKAGAAQVKTKEDLMREISRSGGKQLILTVRRNGELMELSLDPVETPDHDYKLGVWIRDDAQGIGTLTYVDKEGNFGALGHGITDIDTGVLMDIRDGAIYKANILDIVKGKSGTPGEIVGMIQKQTNYLLGSVSKNTGQGIFGKYEEELPSEIEKEAMPIGLKQNVKTGPAQILCQIGDRVERYDIEIEKIEWGTDNPSKGMVLHITDKKLLEQTNGIIQGMSGSPILQEGKVIGAVTHVFIRDSTRGYGIFIENMLKASSQS